MAGAISKSRSMCFPVLCGDAMTKQNSKAGGGDNAEYYINSIREIFWHSLVIRDVCLSAVIRGGSFFAHNLQPLRPHNAALLPAAEASARG